MDRGETATEGIDDILEDTDEFDEIQYKAYALLKQYEFENNINADYDFVSVVANNAISFNVYPKPYFYGPHYSQSYPINEIIFYLQKLSASPIKVYDVHKCTHKQSDDGYDIGFGIIEDKDWFVLAVAPSHRDLANIVKKLTRQGNDRRVVHDSYYNEVYSSHFSSEGESDWCLVDLADTLVLVCHEQLLGDPLSTVNQIKDKFWRFLFSTYYPFPNKVTRYSKKLS